MSFFSKNELTLSVECCVLTEFNSIPFRSLAAEQTADVSVSFDHLLTILDDQDCLQESSGSHEDE